LVLFAIVGLSDMLIAQDVLLTKINLRSALKIMLLLQSNQLPQPMFRPLSAMEASDSPRAMLRNQQSRPHHRLF
jgi:hypothetical protein